MKRFCERPMLSSFGYLEITYTKSTCAHSHFHTCLSFSQIMAKPLVPTAKIQITIYLCFVELNILSETCVMPSSLNN